MPPKKNEPGKKTIEKKKEKVIEVNLLILSQTYHVIDLWRHEDC